MPQSSVAYAVARVHVLERNAMDAAKMDRLLAAQTYDEALRTLSEIGWTGVEAGADAEAIAAERVREACALIRGISPCPDATDCFLLRYDALNLKTLLKARCLGQKAEFLSGCGVFPVETLEHAVADHRYKKLSDTLAKALDGLERTLAVREDALAIDATVDKAIFALIQEKLKGVKSAMVREYFSARADMLNGIMLLRIRNMGKDQAFLKEMLLPGGKIAETEWLDAFEKPEAVAKLLARYGRRVAQAATQACQDAAKLPALEKAMDDALLAGFARVRRDALRLEPVVGHILGAEREAAAVRLILAGKANGFEPDAIRERLRELYGN